MKRWTISVPDDTAAEVMAELDWGDSRSAWVRDAIAMKLASDDERSQRGETPPESGVTARARAVLADTDWQDAANEPAREATLAAVEWFATQAEPQRKSAILDAVESEYADSTLWGKVLQPGLRALVDAGVCGHRRNVGYWVEEEEER